MSDSNENFTTQVHDTGLTRVTVRSDGSAGDDTGPQPGLMSAKALVRSGMLRRK